MTLQTVTSLIDDPVIVIYYRNVFIIQPTGYDRNRFIIQATGYSRKIFTGLGIGLETGPDIFPIFSNPYFF